MASGKYSIYKIEFPNGKVYIGLNRTTLKQRTKEHKKKAKSGDKTYVYNAIRKYKMVDTLKLVPIDTADTLEELCEKEKRYIQEYDSYNYRKGYNMTFGGDGTSGYVYTEDVKNKMSERKKQYHKINPEAGKEHSKRLKQYNEKNPEENSKRLKQYHKINPEAGKENGKKVKQYYEKNPEAREELSKIKKKYYEENPEARKTILDKKGQNKPFDVFTKDGTFVQTFTYKFEAREYLQKHYTISNIDTSYIGKVLRGKYSTAYGFSFQYK